MVVLFDVTDIAAQFLTASVTDTASMMQESPARGGARAGDITPIKRLYRPRQAFSRRWSRDSPGFPPAT
jgi:hypothetical protein